MSLNAVGNIAGLLSGIGKFFSRAEYKERVEDGLINTGDNLAKYSRRMYDYIIANDVKVDKETLKYLLHFSRKWQSDRKKLR